MMLHRLSLPLSFAMATIAARKLRTVLRNAQAAATLLSGDAASQYKTLFTALQKKAPGEKLTLVAKVAVAGLKSLHGNTAELLVFIDQSSTRASDKQKSTSAAQLDVTAVKHGGTWKVTELRPL